VDTLRAKSLTGCNLRSLAVLSIAAIACALVLPLLHAPVAAASDKRPAEASAQIGQFIHVELPITAQTTERVRRNVDRAIAAAKKDKNRLVLVFQFDVPRGQKQAGLGSGFYDANKLADFLSGDQLAGVRTVAFLPHSVAGHAVLPVTACEQIIMAKDATLGAAGVDEKTITPPMRIAYSDIANRRRTVPVAVALGMLDPALEVLQVETEVDQQYVLPDDLPKLKKEHAIKEPVVLKRAGETYEISGAEARRLDFAKYLAADRRDVAKALELPPTAIEENPSLDSDWRAVRVDLKGPITSDSVAKAQHTIEQQIRDQANFICLWIDSPGGSVPDAMQLANFLADLDPSRVRTVAYVPKEARCDAAIVALACDQLVIHPGAVLGGSGAQELTPEEIGDVVREIRHLAPRKGRSWSLVAAMVDPRLDVHRFTRPDDPGRVEYFCLDELNEQADKDKWKQGDLVTIPRLPLKLTGIDAERVLLANKVVDRFSEFRQHYGLENDPTLVEPGWAHTLIDALASPEAAALLLLIGMVGLYIELHSPGVGIGGFVALVCFLLFFWSHYLDGTAGWLEALLFVAGVGCLLLEIFVIPGFGIFGLGGGAMVLASIILASQTSKSFIPRNEYQRDQLLTSLSTIAVACLGMVAVAFFLRSRLPRSPVLNRLMLEPPEGDEAATISRRESLVNFQDLVGSQGTTTTQLTPSGKARFGDLLVDVIADSEVIPPGAAIEVVAVRGNRVLVKEVERA
jgi:membrane-bound serine protease (ClpP class)